MVWEMHMLNRYSGRIANIKCTENAIANRACLFLDLDDFPLREPLLLPLHEVVD